MTAYRLRPALAVRLMGLGVAVAGVTVVGVATATALLGWPSSVVPVVVAVVVTVTLAGLGGLYGVVRLRPVVRLDDAGYVVRWVRGVGAAEGRWTDVEEVVAVTLGGQPCLELRRRDGRRTTVPVGVLDRSAEELASEVAGRVAAGSPRAGGRSPRVAPGDA